MELAGGSWVWSSSLRYLFTLPFLIGIVWFRGNMMGLIKEMKVRPWAWVGWSTVGFGLFYAPLCLAAAYGPAWFIAGSWQITIVAGVLLTPFFYKNANLKQGGKRERHAIPVRELVTSVFILLGVGLLQYQNEGTVEAGSLWSFIPVLVAAFAYPLGNRKMMEICQGRLDVYQRVLGMTMASLPFWMVISLYGVHTVGAPSYGQTMQAFTVAILSGIIATMLFFYATDRAKGDIKKLAIVEATQAGEVVFTVWGEALFLSAAMPAGWPLVGMIIIIAGMVLHSIGVKKS